MAFHDTSFDWAAVPPQLMCGSVDGYASEVGQQHTFRVLYRDSMDRAAKRVVLHLADGTSVEMARARGTSLRHGVEYRAAVTVVADHDYRYHVAAEVGDMTVRYPAEGVFLGPWIAR
jgi:hypothetical protein